MNSLNRTLLLFGLLALAIVVLLSVVLTSEVSDILKHPELSDKFKNRDRTLSDAAIDIGTSSKFGVDAPETIDTTIKVGPTEPVDNSEPTATNHPHDNSPVDVNPATDDDPITIPDTVPVINPDIDIEPVSVYIDPPPLHYIPNETPDTEEIRTSLAGAILNSNYKPVSGARVTLLSRNEYRHRISDQYGEYRFSSLTPQDWLLKVQLPQWGLMQRLQIVSRLKSSTNTISDIVLHDSIIPCRVINSRNGASVKAKRVVLFSSRLQTLYYSPSDDNGELTFYDLANGTYKYLCWPEDHWYAPTFGMLTVYDGQPVYDFIIRMKQALHKVEIQVEDKDGNPVSGSYAWELSAGANLVKASLDTFPAPWRPILHNYLFPSYGGEGLLYQGKDNLLIYKDEFELRIRGRSFLEQSKIIKPKDTDSISEKFLVQPVYLADYKWRTDLFCNVQNAESHPIPYATLWARWTEKDNSIQSLILHTDQNGEATLTDVLIGVNVTLDCLEEEYLHYRKPFQPSVDSPELTLKLQRGLAIPLQLSDKREGKLQGIFNTDIRSKTTFPTFASLALQGDETSQVPMHLQTGNIYDMEVTHFFYYPTKLNIVTDRERDWPCRMVWRRGTRISGTVRDSFYSRPLPDAMITISTPGTGDWKVQTRCDPRGRFYIPPIPDGHYRVSVKASGFLANSVVLQIEDGLPVTSTDFLLETGIPLIVQVSDNFGKIYLGRFTLATFDDNTVCKQQVLSVVSEKFQSVDIQVSGHTSRIRIHASDYPPQSFALTPAIIKDGVIELRLRK